MSNPYQTDVVVARPVLPPDARAGRTFVLALILFNTVLALSVIAIVATTGDTERLPRLLFRLVVNVALMYGLWKGSRWIKWLFALGLFLSALLCLVMLFRFQGPVVMLLLAGAAFLGWAAWNLAYGTSVNEFLAFQRNKPNAE